MPDAPPLVNPGDAVTADAWNRLVDELARLADLRTLVAASRSGGGAGGPGVDASRAVMLAEQILVGYVSVLHPPAVAGVAGWPSATRITAVARYVPSLVIDGGGDGAYPDLGRPVEADEAKIYPARVGDPVLIVRVPDPSSPGGVQSLLWVLTERVARRRCGGGGGGNR